MERLSCRLYVVFCGYGRAPSRHLRCRCSSYCCSGDQTTTRFYQASWPIWTIYGTVVDCWIGHQWRMELRDLGETLLQHRLHFRFQSVLANNTEAYRRTIRRQARPAYRGFNIPVAAYLAVVCHNNLGGHDYFVSVHLQTNPG